MHSPPSIRRNRGTRRNTNRNNSVARRLFNNNNNGVNISRRLFNNNPTRRNNNMRNNPGYVSMERTPDRIVNAYNNNQWRSHINRRKLRMRREMENIEQQRKMNNNTEKIMEKIKFKKLSKTPTKSEERLARKRERNN